MKRAMRTDWAWRNFKAARLWDFLLMASANNGVGRVAGQPKSVVTLDY